MTTFELTETQRLLNVPGSMSDEIELWRSELDGYFKILNSLNEEDPEDVMMYLSGFGARAAEIRSQLNRNENRRSQAFRTKEIDPFISALEFQFKVWSRYVSIREFDAKLSGKGQI